MILIAPATLQVSAQDQKREFNKQRKGSKMENSPEEIAQVQAKKMTLKLDLNEKQQKDVSAVFLEQAKMRQSKKEAYLKSKDKSEDKALSKEERLKMTNARLDEQIEMKKKMKTILTADQYQKWGEMSQKRSKQKRTHHMRYKEKRMTPEKAKQ